MDNTSSENITLDSCGRVQDLRYINDYTDWSWIIRISFPIFLTACTIGNIAGIVIAYKDIKGTKRSFLLFLFPTNLCFMWNKFFMFLGAGIWNPPDPEELYTQFYLMSAGYWMYMDAILYLATQWAILAFCLERYLALTNPLRHYARKRKIGIIGTIALIFVLCIVSSIYSPAVYYWQLSHANIELGEQVQLLPEPFVRWREFDVWLELAVRLFTYVAIVSLDLLIVYSLQNNNQNTLASLNVSGQSAASGAGLVKPPGMAHSIDRALEIGSRRLRASRSATKTLLLSSLFFLVSQSLEVVMQVLVVLNNPPVCGYQITMQFLLIYSPLQVLLSTSYFAGSFFVYISPMQCFRPRKPLVKKRIGGSCATVSTCGSTSVLTGTSTC